MLDISSLQDTWPNLISFSVALYLRPAGTYRIVQRTKEITDKQLRQIADILGVKNLRSFESVTVDFVKKQRHAKKTKKAKKKR
jgi:hypothetical protein